ncbi:MAG: SPFH domain-containing protein [Candidatus Thiodiazotropha sp.]
MEEYIYYLPVLVLLIFILSGIRIVRPTHRGLVERLGRYSRFAEAGFHWIIPVVDKMFQVNTTEQMVDAEPRVIITNDNLNVTVDAQVYFKINQDEDNVKNSQYNVDDVRHQMVSLARTTLRNIIGTLSLKSANSERNKINKELYDTLMSETKSWGVEIIRAELKQIEPPKDVQSTMNQVVKAENEKIAAIDFATAKETEADGQKRATIKHAEGVRTSRILHAEGEAEAIRLVNEAANQYFVGNAQLLKRLETLSNSLEDNTTIVVPSNSDLVNVIGELAGVLPINKKPNVNEM